MKFFIPLLVILTVGVAVETFFMIDRVIFRKRLRNVREKMALLIERMHEKKNPDEFYRAFVEIVSTMFPRVNEITLEIQDEKNPENFKFVAQKGYTDELIGISIPKREFALYQLNKFEKAAIIKNPKDLPNEKLKKIEDRKRKNRKNGLREIIVAPLMSFDSPYGLLSLCSFKKNTFKSRDVMLTRYINDEINFIVEYFKMISEKSKEIDYDQLTALNSRQKLLDELELRTKKTEKRKAYIFVIIDLDHFKEVNDNFGHIVGDKTLRYFSSTIRENIPQDVVCGRYGGDEFGLIFNTNSAEYVHGVILNIRKKFAHFPSEDGLYLDFTYGLFPFFSDGHYSTSQIIEFADRTLYYHKEKREN